MNTTCILFASGALALGLCASTAAAQTSGKPVESNPAAPRGPAVTTTASGSHVMAMPETPALASKIIGTEIVDAAGNEIAEVKDLMIADSGEVSLCVERTDDLMVCVPLANLETRLSTSDMPVAKAKEQDDPATTCETSTVKQFALKGDRKLFDTAPTVKDAKLMDRAFMTHSADHFAGRAAGDAAKTMPAHDDPMPNMKGCCAKTLIGQDVKGTDGDDIGDVKDLAINLRNSHVAYAIVSVGGVLGVGDSLHAIAFDRLTQNEDSVTIPMTKDGCSNLPKLDLDRLPASVTASVSMHKDVPAGSR